MTTLAPRPTPPAEREYRPFYAGYVQAAVAEAAGDPLAMLERQAGELRDGFLAFGEARGGHRYAPGKWSVKEVAGHIADAERVFAYRALRAARADETPLAGFDENAWVASAGFDRRPLAELVDDLLAVRAATLRLYASFDAAAFDRRVLANGNPVTVRALVYITAGHAAHHLRILRERYG